MTLCQVVSIDLVLARWEPVATKRRGRYLDNYYSYGSPPQRCYLICQGLRDNQLLGQVAEVSIEFDEGGPVITIHRLVNQDLRASRPTRLSRLLWPNG